MTSDFRKLVDEIFDAFERYYSSADPETTYAEAREDLMLTLEGFGLSQEHDYELLTQRAFCNGVVIGLTLAIITIVVYGVFFK